DTGSGDKLVTAVQTCALPIFQSRGHSTDSLRSSRTRLICERADRRLNALGWIRPQLRVIRVPPCSKPEARRDLDSSLGWRMAPDTTDTTLRPLTPFRQ